MKAIIYFAGVVVGASMGFVVAPLINERSFFAPNPDWSKVERAYAACGDGSSALSLKSKGPVDEKFVITWLRDIANDIDVQGWSARTNDLGSCSVYAGPRVNGKLPSRPLEGDEIRKLREGLPKPKELGISGGVLPSGHGCVYIKDDGNIVPC